MTEFSFSRRRRLVAPALPVVVALAGALLCAGGPAAAEDAANPNVIVDDSALDGPNGANNAGASNSNNELLPAPARQPLSRLVTPGQSAVEAATPQTTSDATVSAVPTTPIESTSLDGSQEPGAAAATAPAAGAAVEGAAASAPPPAPASGDSTAAATQTAEGTVPDAAAAGQQTAAKPPIDGMLRLTFDPESSVISDAAKAQLGPLVEKLNTDVLLRIQVLAYAGGDDDA